MCVSVNVWSSIPSVIPKKFWIGNAALGEKQTHNTYELRNVGVLFLARLFLNGHQRYPSNSLFSFVKKKNYSQKLQQIIIIYQQVVVYIFSLRIFNNV